MSLISKMAAPIACLTTVGMGIGLSIPLLTLEMEAMGISGQMIGANTAVPSLAAIFLTPFIPKLASRIGTSNLILIALATSVVSFGLFLIEMPFWMWFPLRFIFGAAIYSIFVISEYWINEAVEDHQRAFILGIYATILSLGFAMGPIILTVAVPGTPWPYLVGITIFALGAVPILVWRYKAPTIRIEKGHRIFRYLLASPTSALAAFTFGALETGSFSLLAVYALHHGYSESGAAAAVAFVALGAVFFQVPLGLIADRVDRRLMLIFCALVGLIGALMLPYVVNTYLLFPVLIVWGGIVVGLYTIGLAHLGEKFSGPDLISANSLFIFLYALGSLISPVMIGKSIDIWDPQGYVWATISFTGLFLVVAIWRWLRRPAIWRASKTPETA